MAFKMVANSLACGVTETDVYETASNTKAQIVRLSVVNNGDSTTWFSVYLHPAGGASAAPLINRKVIQRYVTDNCIELIGHEIMPKSRITVVAGDTVYTTLTVDE